MVFVCICELVWIVAVEASPRPDGQVMLWDIAEDTTEQWAASRYPQDWKVASGWPLGLGADAAYAKLDSTHPMYYLGGNRQRKGRKSWRFAHS